MAHPHRRQFLSASAVAALGLVGAEPKDNDPITQSPRLPEPHVGLPTDAVPRQGPPRRIAAITTTYFKYSHADDIITKFIEGYGVVGRIHRPHCQVVSLYIEQMPNTDIGQGLAARYK